MVITLNKFKKIGNKARPNNLSGVGKTSTNRLGTLTPGERSKVEGVACAKKVEAKPEFNKAECETVFEGENNQRIVLGRDRPHSNFSGYGGRGDSHSSMIDLVAGAYGVHAKEENEAGERIKIDPNFGADAARIYLAQRTDVDRNFGLSSGRVGNPESKSAAAVKADSVRIIAREGIKLVTKTDTTNSAGGNVIGTQGIDLIAGNDDSDMQPLVKGDNLVKYLERMSANISQLNGMIMDIVSILGKLQAGLAGHTHPVVTTMGAGYSTPSPELSATIVECSANLGVTTVPSIINNKINLMNQEIQALSQYPGGTSIISKHNYTN